MIARIIGIIVLGMVVLPVSPAGVAAQALRLPSPTVTFASGRHGRVTGYILNRDGDDLLLRDETTSAVSLVTVTSRTNISSPSGFLNLERTAQPPTTLIPGLLIAVDGTGGARGALVADRIRFSKDALQIAKQISAGDVVIRARERQTAAIAAANRDSIERATARVRDSLEAINARISKLDAYVLRVRGTVYFAANSAALTEEARDVLDDLMEKSRGLEGFLIEVSGFTDGSGSMAEDQALSARRAQSVIEYLTTAHAVPLRRIATPVGFGSTRAVAVNTTPEGRARNRRVDVRVVVNRAQHEPPDR